MDSLEANGEAELDISEHALEPLQAVGGFNSHSLGISRVHQASLSEISGFRRRALKLPTSVWPDMNTDHGQPRLRLFLSCWVEVTKPRA